MATRTTCTLNSAFGRFTKRKQCLVPKFATLERTTVTNFGRPKILAGWNLAVQQPVARCMYMSSDAAAAAASILDTEPSQSLTLTRTEIRKMKVSNLREHLDSLGLSTDRPKVELVSRMIQAIHGRESVCRNTENDNLTLTGLSSYNKTDKETLGSKAELLDPSRAYALQFRGHAMKWPPTAGAGMILYQNESGEEIIWSARQFIKIDSRFEAHYHGLLTGMQYALSRGVRNLVVQTDNEVIIKQMKGDYKVKKSSVVPLYWAALALQEKFTSFHMMKISKEDSAEVGFLARTAVGTKKSEGVDSHIMWTGSPKPEKIQSKETYAKHEPIVQQLDAQKRYLLQFDGGARGNPGVAGAGMVLYDMENSTEVWCGWKFLTGPASNNVAEYSALITGLHSALSLGVADIQVQGDSDLVVKQITGVNQVRSPKLETLHEKATTLSKQFSNFTISHIPRAENRRADDLANHAMDNKDSFGFEEYVS